MKPVESGSFLTLHYRLARADGADLVNTFGDKPATLSLGTGALAPAIEALLIGMNEGTRARFDISGDEVFGERNPQLVQRVSRALLARQGVGGAGRAVGDVVQEGQTVQFQLRDAKSASEDLNLLLAADRAAHRGQPLGALMFSCCGRGRGLFGKPNHDAATMADRLGSIPLAGFFAQGEIGPVGGRNFLHGYTACMALFAEQDSAKVTI